MDVTRSIGSGILVLALVVAGGCAHRESTPPANEAAPQNGDVAIPPGMKASVTCSTGQPTFEKVGERGVAFKCPKDAQGNTPEPQVTLQPAAAETGK